MGQQQQQLKKSSFTMSSSNSNTSRNTKMPSMLQESKILPDEEVPVPVPVPVPDETVTTSDDTSTDTDLDRCHWGELIFALMAGFVFIGLQHVPGKSLVYFLVALCTLSGLYVLYKI